MASFEIDGAGQKNRWVDKLGLTSRTTRRALVWIILIGFIGSFSLTGYQFFRDKAERIALLEDEIQALGKVFAAGLAQSLWVLDIDQIENQLKGVVELPLVSGIILDGENKIQYQYGSTIKDERQLQASFPIAYQELGEVFALGELIIVHDLEKDIDEIFSQQLINFVGNTLVILLIALSVSLVFQVFVIQRLMGIISELNNISAADLRTLPERDHLEDVSEDWDELDALARSVYVLRQTGYEVLSEADRKGAVMRNQNVELYQALENERKIREQHRTFVTMVSHEFRTPLAVIDNIAQGVIRRQATMSPEDIEKRMVKARTAINRLTSLMESVLVSERMEEGAIKLDIHKVEVKGLIEGIVETQRRFVKHELNCLYKELPEEIDGDVQMLRLVLENLIVNACKYSPDADRVDIEVWCESDMVYISIRDYGIGIPKKDRERMFERFFRASNVTGISGSGIGLNTARNIIELHGGKVSLDSQENVGTIFTASLPLGEDVDHHETV
ncbi:putative Histidine kinase [Candidatus Terasakiella magnetica]|uniref:histidine kinase n=1 Tax=Candidatus Terasakiella magnetica TaxID=1867952 RepID=A0A1C3RE16_9PROT|nr:ATP-binding protein [Candidatus Terasakiella magnetica]SCA55536.1 putative Histidine kinase [Candidatus Terasakiella magnetica]